MPTRVNVRLASVHDLSWRWLLGGAAALLLAACNDSNPQAVSNPPAVPNPPAHYTVGGSIKGLTGSGLVLSNGADQLNVAADATAFIFPTAVGASGSYAVTVRSSPVGIACSVANSTGIVRNVNVNNVMVTCSARAYGLGGTISGLNGAGLVLANGTNRVAVATGASDFNLAPVAFSSAYSVTVATQPAGLSCAVTQGKGNMPAAAVTSIEVACADQPYTLGGNISGLNSSGLVLTDGTDWLAVAANANRFSMPTRVTFSSKYTVTVAAQPAGANCTVTGGSASMPANDVSTVQVTCAARYWTWQGGPNASRASGVYGTQGSAAAGNVPGARLGAMFWNGTSGQRWLFGGVGFDVNGNVNDLSDLWSYNETTRQWTWVSGPNTGNGDGTYGAQGSAAVGNLPSSRKNSATWTDAAGTLWLFGGYHDGTGNGYLNDLWSYNPGTGLWTWVNGSSASNGGNTSCTNALGVYGTQGAASSGNTPGARLAPVTWVDGAGNLWLHGGVGCDSAGTLDVLNDVWVYKPTTNQWTWIGGSTLVGASGVYGTQGVAAALNAPGARQAAVSWVDAAGHVWLCGGYGVDSSGVQGNLNDLWSYDPTKNLWTWLSGSNLANASGIYGARGNTPGARDAAQSWIDSQGHLLMFGGVGQDSQGNSGWLNDLWSFDPTTQQWTWVNGSNTINGVGVYGSLGVGDAGNLPGARFQTAGWIDGADHLWLFGGYGLDYTANDYYDALSDMFEY